MSSGVTREDANKALTGAGFPLLGAINMLPPALVVSWVKKEVAMRDPLDYLTPAEVQVLYCGISAANNCEMCLSFHALGLKGLEAISEEDLALLVAGGIPSTPLLNDNNGRLKTMAIAAKYCAAHKGILLEREKKHLVTLGIGQDELYEILYVCAHIHANNILFVSLIANGCPVEDMLKQVGPFKDTVYKA